MKKILMTESQVKLLTEGSRKKYFVNLDVELPKGGRTSAKITPKEFEDKMREIWETHKEEKRFTLDNFVYTFLNKWTKDRPKSLDTVVKDISKVDYDTENMGAIGKVSTSNGITYLKCYAGGDWECPILFFLYWDGAQFRGYIPTYGNAFNRKLKRAFGNGDDEDVEFLKTQNLEVEDEELSSIIDRIFYDEDACLKDFKSRVKLNR